MSKCSIRTSGGNGQELQECFQRISKEISRARDWQGKSGIGNEDRNRKRLEGKTTTRGKTSDCVTRDVGAVESLKYNGKRQWIVDPMIEIDEKIYAWKIGHNPNTTPRLNINVCPRSKFVDVI